MKTYKVIKDIKAGEELVPGENVIEMDEEKPNEIWMLTTGNRLSQPYVRTDEDVETVVQKEAEMYPGTIYFFCHGLS